MSQSNEYKYTLEKFLNIAQDFIDVHGTETIISSILSNENKICLVWGVEDVIGLRTDLSEEQAKKVLDTVKRGYNPENGVNYLTLKETADSIFSL